MIAGLTAALLFALVPDDRLSVAVSTPVDEVDLGELFELQVELRWDSSLRTPTWTEQSLHPLAVELIESEREDDGSVTQETYRYSARSFSLGEVALEDITVHARAKSGDATVTARAAPVRWKIQPRTAPEDTGVAELPGGLLPIERPGKRWWPWLVAAGVLVIAIARWSRARETTETPAPSLSPRQEALKDLRQLREDPRLATMDSDTFAIGLSTILREFLDRELRCPAARMSTEQTLAVQGDDAVLADLLNHCDRSKFARWSSAREHRLAELDRAEEWVKTARRPA